MRRSTDKGATFENIINLSNNIGSTGEISVVASGNNVYVAWADFHITDIEIHYRRSTDNGATFEDTVNLSSDSFY